MDEVRVGVLDIGANTARMVVFERGLIRVAEDRASLSLGAEIEANGGISAAKLVEVEESAAGMVAMARLVGASRIEALITSPGRQSANGAELAAAVRRGCGHEPRLLSAEDEARLGYAGAVAARPAGAGPVAVCDVGGGSAQVAIGSNGGEPVWLRSIDLGSLRLTRRHLGGDPPRVDELLAAADAVEAAIDGMAPPLPRTALAIGGTARALKKIVGPALGPAQLAEALDVLSSKPAKKVAATYGIVRWRAEVLPGGALILHALQQRLLRPLEVVRGGVREGAALAAFSEAEAA
jgi:exopolyphosphatase / guanosine-5'-triphosphate,3'-diphosphate pyrophosphatase